MAKSKFYLDTNIIRDIISNRNRDSIIFFELSKLAQVELYTSIYALMELIDIKKDEIFFNNTVMERGLDINKFLRIRNNKKFEEHDIDKISKYQTDVLGIMDEGRIQILNLQNDGWLLAMNISSISCLTADDSLHLATVFTGQCDYLVTNDTEFIAEARKIIEDTDQPEIECFDSKKALASLRQKIQENGTKKNFNEGGTPPNLTTHPVE